MSATNLDSKQLLEYSVVYTERAVNHMSMQFQAVMRGLSYELRQLYQADAVAIVPGSGTFGMEAVVHTLAKDKDCVVIRNGWFSYRWTQIMDATGLVKSCQVFKAQAKQHDGVLQFVPADIDKVVDYIHKQRPQLVFAPHVETASGIMLPDDYIKALAQAVHAVDGLLVVDCIASGCLWLDMKKLGIDVLLSAPQKGLSSTPCAGLVMLSDAAKQAVACSTPSSFALDLRAWLNVMAAYDSGGHAYHATMPTDGLVQLYQALLEAKTQGYDVLKNAQITLGERILALLNAKGINSVADRAVQAYGVIVCHAPNEAVHKGAAFAEVGVQIAAGVPLQLDEPADYRSFRIGLFGIDKLTDIDGTVARFALAADQVFAV
ncbi:aspartate aminotransferase [Moraxella cuniculi DSM 21768]|uniref:Aspartate aminotransferase n=1 Tax=Moraxella cuniculi DSM 21768 TaxID=1122245 RepID=A0A1N7ECD6_9GAMM|nr:aminotransferase class V-fold PLP-dependent enzyme [Moraxella cuniculi]OOS05363.1 class V aminotransferase [Moraxella cuniculi]SIR85638.1 aspartate aminotransferase [Moraxella cuniculi DSM 21768]